MRNSDRFAFMAAAFVLAGAPAWAQDKAKELEIKRANTPVEGRTLYEWQRDLRDSKDPSVREKAISVLKYYGTAARDALSDIIKATDDKDVSVKVNAIITLGFIGLDAAHREAGLSALNKCLTVDSQGIVRFQAARALARLGSDAGPAVPHLLNALKNTSTWEIRAAAANALGSAGWDPMGKGQNREAVRALIDALYDSCLEVRFEAIRSLIMLGKPALLSDLKQEEAALQKLTSVKQPKKVAIWARVALLRLADKVSGDKVSEKHLGEIANFLKSADYQSRLQAAHALATIGREARSRMKDLIDALDDKEPAVLVFICIALGEMGDAAEKAVPSLNRLKEHENEAVKEAAKEAITKITQKVKAEEPAPAKKNRP